MLRYFLSILFKPTVTIQKILDRKPSFLRIIHFLFWIGLLRGVLEIIWLFSIPGQYTQLIQSLSRSSWYLKEAIPFLLANVLTAYFRWAMYALIIFLGARLFKIRVIFSSLLRLYGVILGLYILPGLINFVYVFITLPIIKFKISSSYFPMIGLGQFIGALWFILLTLKVARILFKMDWINSFLLALAIPILDRVLFVLSAKVYFGLPALAKMGFARQNYLAICIFILASTILIPLFIWIGYRLNEEKRF